MKLTQKVKRILSWYSADTPGTKASLARFLMAGKLGGTGRMVILPVDQGFEHGPARSFAANPAGYDPRYHPQLALDAGLNGYAAPLGMLEHVADEFAPQVPLILKVNSANSLSALKDDATQALTGTVEDALRLGCAAVGFTIYPGSDSQFGMMEEVREMIAEAKAVGLAAVVWSYPRGAGVAKEGETAVDVVAYAAHMAALLGAHIIKVKPPKDLVWLPAAQKTYADNAIPTATLTQRIAHVMQACFDSQRLVVFSGGEAKSTEDILAEVREIRDGGGHGSIIGRNSFQRPREEALSLLSGLVDVYRGKD